MNKAKPFAFNPDTDYPVGPKYHGKTIGLNSLEVFVTQKDSFNIKVLNPFKHYLNPPITNDIVPKRWFSHPMQFFQNQLNFAIFCATTGCGVSYVNHLNHSDNLMRSVYQFHAYYQTRRILTQLGCPLWGENSFNPFNNPIDISALQHLCNEFNITHTNFRQNLDVNNGLGSLYVGAEGVHNLYQGPYVRGITSFNHRAREVLKSIEQHHPNAWTTFILDEGNGFTQSGVERLNDSIRTYVWAILAAQAETRSTIIGNGTSFDSQKQFLSNLEDSINKAENLPSSIKMYENVLKFSRSPVNFVIGTGLYMIPSDLRLQIGIITNYNNFILIAPPDLSLGIVNVNQPLNTVLQSPASETDEQPKASNTTTSPGKSYEAESHESTKRALIFGLVSTGLLFLYFYY